MKTENEAGKSRDSSLEMVQQICRVNQRRMVEWQETLRENLKRNSNRHEQCNSEAERERGGWISELPNGAEENKNREKLCFLWNWRSN